MQNTYLAHIDSDGREQALIDHLVGTAERAKRFAALFDSAGAAELAGLAHDLGKYSEAFQKRLHGGPRVDHATSGAFVCCQQGQICAAFAVVGHHTGLPDGGSRTDPAGTSTFYGRIAAAAQGKLENADAWRREVSLPAPLHSSCEQDPLEGMFYIRMLYSCLVDADYLDTETFMLGQERQTDGALSIDELWERLCTHIAHWFPPQGDLNRQRCAILQRCMDEGCSRSPGLFSLTVPTGGGKTVSSLAFALAHAKTHHLQRVIYVIPYTSIIEQTADVFREILGEENVLEHHSNAGFDIEDEADAKNTRMAQATENWDVPVVVTTAVQFFQSLYAYRSSQCRKLHNIAGSVVVFDEAQMLPIPYLRPCVYAMAQLVKYYGVSAVLSTATQPALEPLFREFLPTHSVTELCPATLYQWNGFRRVTIRRTGRLTWEELAGRLSEQDQVLCIVNSRKGAQTLFHLLQGEGCYHLSTLMYPAHRRTQLKEIRQRLADGLPCCVVSTSLIEAGVDVDFPAVYREEAGLDSILQAAGRCNREGKRPADESIVTVFQSEEKTPPLFAAAVGAARLTIARFEDISCQQAIHYYFQQLLDLKGDEAQDVKRLMKLMREELLPFRKVAERFQLIESPTRIIYIPLGDGQALLDRFCAGERSRRLFRKLGQYGVSVYEQHFASLNRAGDLELLEDGSAILRNTILYSEATGLSLAADGGKGLFI
nr:CRISPR-associated helicase Cas3' [uncultured Agathobaculum sp.]